MALPKISQQRKFFSKLLTFWIPVKSYRRAFRGILQLGIRKYFNVLHTDKTKKFTNEIAIGAIMKDEGPYLKEWLDFHILVGIKKFFLYDNGSNDNTKEILSPYIEHGIVEYHYFPGKHMQLPAYLDIINNHTEDTRWLALIDLDEFLVPVHHKTVTEFLHTLPQNFAQLVVTWVIYGSSGHIHKPDGLVIENYKHHAKKTWGVKSIVNPRLLVEYKSLHANFIAGWTIDNNGKKLGYINQTNNPPAYDKLRINHYYTKSYDEYIARLNRGSATTQSTQSYRGTDKFKEYDRNEIYDDVMDRFIEKLKHEKN
ncbi:MAG: glycosyltransferase family 92 protein [Alphaproteobacteria bacterium]|nr:glycosyltransferase family 92 protein [Alphaproteobacteria bacterium]